MSGTHRSGQTREEPGSRLGVSGKLKRETDHSKHGVEGRTNREGNGAGREEGEPQPYTGEAEGYTPEPDDLEQDSEHTREVSEEQPISGDVEKVRILMRADVGSIACVLQREISRDGQRC
jgi:hypothetical protein